MEIDGRKIANDIIEGLKNEETPDKILAAVLVGDDPRSLSFLKEKEKTAKKLGVDFRLYKLPGDISKDELRHEIGRISRQSRVGGVVLQLPLPDKVSADYALRTIPREKDIDVLGERSIIAFSEDRNPVIPPAAETVKEIISRQKIELKNSIVAVLGLGALVGKPVSIWLTGKCKELILLGRENDKSALKRADIVISGVGSAGILSADILKDGAGVIDFGYSVGTKINGDTGRVLGDFNAEGASLARGRVAFYTPTPGGTGPILVAALLRNFYILCKEKG